MDGIFGTPDNQRGAFRAISGLILAIFVTSVAVGVISTLLIDHGSMGRRFLFRADQIRVSRRAEITPERFSMPEARFCCRVGPSRWVERLPPWLGNRAGVSAGRPWTSRVPPVDEASELSRSMLN